MAKKTPAPELPPVPEFASDRLRLLGPLITPRVVELARMRFLDGNAFIKSGKLQVPDEKSVVKAALILHYEMNPFAELDFEEEALLTGVCSATLRDRKKEELDQVRTQLQRLVLKKIA